MSLHQLAHHVQSAGRGEDKVLVHMTPGEVKGLQSLAMAHGGSLTINPQTGLPEAGFLSRLLPMIAGFALGPAGFGLTAMQAGLAVGAVGTAATGSLGKGLMMGLGAYGGAGLGGGLQSMGTTTPTSATPNLNVATPTTAGAPTGVEGLKTNLYGEGQGVFSTVTKSPTPGITSYTAPTPQFDISKSLAQANMPTGVVAPPAPFANPQSGMAATPNVVQSLPTQATVETTATIPQTSMQQVAAGARQATSSMQGLKDLYAATEKAAPYSGVAGLGSYALGSYYDKLDQAKPPKEDTGMIRPYTYERTQRPEAYDMGEPIYSATPGSSRERNYFNEKYTALTPYKAPGPEYAAKGGLMGLAVGGPVEMMSAMNAVGDNQMYPQSQLQTPLYSNPAVQRPEAVNVISPSAEPAVGMYSGEQKFARGGDIDPMETTGEYKYSYNPQTMQYTQLAAPSYVNPRDGLLVGPNAGSWSGPRLGPAMGKMPESQPSIPPVGTVSGGITQPAAQPAAMPAQSIYTPPPIPAYQTPEQQLGLESFYPMMEQRLAALGASQGYAGGGLSHLGDYSDGGRLLKGPGDGVSDSIPAVIGNRQPARLADGEFVVPARIVSELGNGSTEAGARKLYAMMDRVQKARRKTVGKNKVAANTRSEKYLPA